LSLIDNKKRIIAVCIKLHITMNKKAYVLIVIILLVLFVKPTAHHRSKTLKKQTTNTG